MSKLVQKFGGIALTLAVAGIVLSGCGRKVELDRPSTPVEQQNIRKTGDDRKPEPVPEKRFLLDPLL